MQNDKDGDSGPPADDVMSASGVRSRYEKLFRERQAAAVVSCDICGMLQIARSPVSSCALMFHSLNGHPYLSACWACHVSSPG